MSDDEQTPPAPRLQEQVTERLQAERIIVLDGELDDKIGTRLCSQLFLLSYDDPRTDISLWINSPGGSVPAMLAIMDTIRLIPNDVSTLAMGLACSAGQFLLTVGTNGKRFALPHARILMHQGSAGIGGNAVDIELQADDLRHTRDTVLALIAEHTGQSLATIHEDSQRDRWYSAEQARDYGFVDGILDSFEGIRPRRRSQVGLGGGR
jgi:ATP-dependent Clp protease protease subunit